MDLLRKSLAILAIATALGLISLGCAPEREAPTDASAADIPVGVFAGLTGPTATFGQATRDGATLAAEEINAAGGVLGRKIRLLIEDNQGRPDEAASVVTKLITANEVIALIGENASNRSLAAAPIAQAHQTPMISPSSTNPEVTRKGDYIFRVCYTDPYQGAAIAAFTRRNLGFERVAILKDLKNDYSIGLAEFFGEAFRKSGGSIVADQSYSEGDNDFRSQLTAIARAKPQAIFIPGYYTDVGSIAIQARDLRIDLPLIGGDGWDSPKLLEIGGSALEGAYFANHYFVGEDRPAVRNFVDKFRRKHGRDPDAVNALSYDATRILADAIARAGSLDRKAIRDEIARTKEFAGVAGVITMGEDRNPVKPVAMLKIEKGEIGLSDWIQP
ncbi:MAG TPA: ABC transporter substrate-binding protein [Thermoanaerobaculia bacterium]|nr:ABC transporter substrate-binding protein [Thermoanaerobaculia bacterium]